MAKLVVLEDDSTLLELYRDVLERADFEVFAAGALQLVVEHFEKNEADLILADLRLGATTAEETILALKKIREQHDIATILISAQMMIYEDTCREAGFEHLMTKPFPNRVLINKVKEVLGQSEA